jgi:DNA-binding cell septation regulator SpoVG
MVQDIRSYVASTIQIKDVIDRVKVGLQLVMPDAKVSACEIRDVTHDLGRLRAAEAF